LGTLAKNISPFVPWNAMAVRAVFLVGFMASGKSTVGPELARRLSWDFVDLDTQIESREQKTVSEIFRERGEAGFRLAETTALRDLLTGTLHRDCVIALGGGAFVQETNRELLRDWPSIFLEAPTSELWQRSLSDGIERPLRGDPDQFAKLYAQRLPFYRQATVTIVTSGKDPASLCVEIERNLQSWGHSSGKPVPPSSSQILPARSGTGESQ
jgi:shikimate kinase